MKHRPTIRDLAKEAGVSIGTASRAMNRTGRVSEQAIAAVMKAAQKLGYEPDAVAQSMRTGSTRVVGLLVSELSNPLYARIIDAVEGALQAAGYTLLVASTHNSSARERELTEIFRRRRVDGLIMGPCDRESPEILKTLEADVPVVALDRDFDASGTGVHVDHFQGALQATRYLLHLGHKRIVLMTAGSHRRPGRERIAGFEDAFRERGLKPDAKLIRVEPSALEYAFSEALSLLALPDPPTAFLCLGTRILSGVLQAMKHAGRTAPDDVSVVSIGDTDLAQLFTPAITSVTWDLDAVGRSLAELLLKRLHSENVDAERVVVTTQMILRESCGPTRGAGLTPRKKPLRSSEDR